jgi:tetratricopeptide (TPR) repeat protein
VLLLLDFWPLGRHRAAVAGAATAARGVPLRLVLEKVPLFALAALSGLITLQAQTAGGAVTSLEAFPLAARAANALLSAVGYLGKTLWPSGLAVFYPFRIRPLTDPGVLAAGAVLATASVVAFRLRRRRPWLLAGWLWYLITLLPVIGLVQVGDQAMADRYTYLPLVGVFVAGAWELDGVARRRAAARVVLAGGAVLALLLLAGLTRRQVAVWKDDETLNGHAARVTADNWWATYHLGLARESAGDPDGALRFYREALRMKPDFSRGRYAYALVLEQEGRVADAAEQLRTVRRALPADPVIGMRLALLLDRVGRDDEAIQVLRELVARRPEIAEVCNNLAVLLSRRGRVEEAAALLRRAVVLDPAYAEARRNLELLTGEPPASGGAGE